MKRILKELRKLELRLKNAWQWILVFLGLRIWAKDQWNRPKFSLCAFHGIYMKRTKKTKDGADYYCRKCRKTFHLESGGNKLVAA